MPATTVKPQKPSKTARLSAARLAAAQAVYQMMANQQKAAAVVQDFRTHRFGKPVDGQVMVMPDEDLFESIVVGVEDRSKEIEAIIVKPGQAVPAEPLLRAIMLCAVWELTATQTDTPLVIAEYLNVTHAFFDKGESRLINGVLDRVAKEARGS
ncbi:MAG TPA: transcription antitermination factor NusB [Patescibacteria group bacterium]|jgi:N utilization substance protein B|nr:transcription antitermination factor NusB [Patescibacteria group bacterium]